MQSRITELDPPRQARHHLGSTGGVTFELKPEGDAVLLTLIHRRVPDRATLLNVSAGWHMHLDILAARAAAGSRNRSGTDGVGSRRTRPADTGLTDLAGAGSARSEGGAPDEVARASADVRDPTR